MSAAVIGVAFLFFLGHFLKWLFIKSKVPDLLTLVLLGYLLGPVFGVIKPEHFGSVGDFMTTLALIVILYGGGLSIRAKDLANSSLPALGLTIVAFSFIAILAALIALSVGQPMEIALLFGIGIGSTSSAIVIPMVKYLSISERTKTILSLESAFTDVLAIVIFLVLAEGAAKGLFDIQKIAIGVGPDTLKAVILGVGSGLFWSFLKAKFLFLNDIRFSGEAWAMLTYGLIDYSELNGAMAVMALGFTLANLDLIPQFAKNHFSPTPVNSIDMVLLDEASFMLRTFFFIFLGMKIQFSDWLIVLVAFVVAVLIFATRLISVYFVMSKDKYSRVDAMITTAMGPRGLACAVLATVPVQMGVPGGQWVQDAVFALIPMTVVLTATFVVLSETPKFRPLLDRFFLKYPEKLPETQV